MLLICYLDDDCDVQVIATVSATDADDALQHTHVEYQLMPEAGQLFSVHRHTYVSYYRSLFLASACRHVPIDYFRT